MLRSIATLTLLIAQAAAWVGGPQFRCVDNEGSICVDEGPRSCHCREDEESATTTHHCERHEHSTLAACDETAVSPGDCDCTHELLGNEGAASVSRSSGSTDLHESRQSVAPFAVAMDVLNMGHIAARLAPDAAALSPPPLILLSPVALRC
jgi:hypothetical protein